MGRGQNLWKERRERKKKGAKPAIARNCANPRVPQLIARTRASAQLREPAATLNPRVSIKSVLEKPRPPQLRAAGAKV